MRSIIGILLVLLTAQVLKAQSSGEDTLRTGRKTHWYNNFQLRIPEFYIERVFPIRNKDFSSLPYGMNHYMYPTMAEIGSFGQLNKLNNYSFRILGLYYKERIGLEFCASGYGARIAEQPFKDYLQTKFSNYYASDSQIAEINRFSFTGFKIGLAYEMHWKGLLIIPKLFVGFEKLQDSGNTWRFKEKGSNQFTNYTIRYQENNWPQNSYRVELRLAKRIHLGKGRTYFEVGLKTEYLVSGKKQLQLQIIEEAYGKPATKQNLAVSTRYQSFATGVYVNLFFKSKHLRQ
jgi:hypothetical protein